MSRRCGVTTSLFCIDGVLRVILPRRALGVQIIHEWTQQVG